ncbi:site-specific DNA-methyltransferase [Ottowia sp.]|uniref:site-specific DNA-methyltransferase n=1 Tax=Ottowia sp. TaxID=1898956 RepID=UPI002D07B7D1|nr:site-specific DNA-methyltransferase [Ottowia sp.]HRN75985.1 site-specific DNA-methyltransferase [Ottowia sp.]
MVIQALMHIEQRPLDALIPYARNARTHSEAQVAQIAASIREFGFNNPILVDGDSGIIAGHGRVLAARVLGLADVPVIELAHLSAAQKRAFILAENKLTERGGWDAELLALELADLEAQGFDLELTGFEAAEIASLLESQVSDPPSSSEAEDVPEPPLRAVTRLGDIWCIGPHRVACGDAGDPSLVAALMQGGQAALCFTSPPYANQRHYTTGGIGDWDTLMQRVCAALPMRDDGQVLVNLGLIHRDNEFIAYWDGWLAWMRTQGWRRFAWYVWDQGPGMPGDWNGRLAPSFEFIFHFNRQTRRPHKTVPCKWAGQETHLRADGSSTAMRKANGEIGGWTHAGQPTQGTRIPDAVIRIMRQKGKIGEGIDHPAVFPVALPEHILAAYSDVGEICFEPFCGSGSSLIAAQRTGRVLRGVELATGYVDVAVERFRRLWADTPITLDATGQDWAEVAIEREVQA